MRLPAAPIVIAHRGYRRRFPENTLAAFRAANTAGAEMIELDVTLSRDGVPVVIHDDSLQRTTSGHGLVARCSVAELQALDAGSWFGDAFAGERIPTLVEVLSMRDRPPLVNVEIKPPGEPPQAVRAVLAAVISALRQTDTMAAVLISSFDPRVLAQCAALPPPRPAIGVLTSPAPDEALLERCRRLGAFSCHPNQRHLEPQHVRRLKTLGVRVYPYTVNEPARIRQLLAMGVDGIITDDPPLVRGLLAAHKPSF
jgi:glycerophosphoryl diester phosphodiesterase